jgi:peroxiredoxin
VLLLADGSADFAKAMGLDADFSAYGMGIRCKRFALVAEDGVVKVLNVEAPGQFEVSSADYVLNQL